MRRLDFTRMSEAEKKTSLERSAVNLAKAIETAREISTLTRSMGLEAVLSFARKYDQYDRDNILVSEEEIAAAGSELTAIQRTAIEKAAENIAKFHQAQKPKSYTIETSPGVVCERVFTPIENVGVYIPGGTAALPSTALMLGIPAKIAGCKRVVLATPAKKKVPPAVLFAAAICGIKEIYAVGGAHAISMLAYGIEEIPKVDKIFGPGNQFVTAAKMLVSTDPKGCAFDMPAGPSEIIIVADKNARPEFIAADFLSQAEHGADSQAILFSDSDEILEKVAVEIEVQKKSLLRQEYINKSLEHSALILTSSIKEAFKSVNYYAPEHLVLHIDNARSYMPMIQNAGSVFLGNYSPESAGDYASGVNHALPTSGFARSFGGVSVESFMKSMTVQELTKDGLAGLSETICTIADIEQLDAHKRAVTIRFEK